MCVCMIRSFETRSDLSKSNATVRFYYMRYTPEYDIIKWSNVVGCGVTGRRPQGEHAGSFWLFQIDFGHFAFLLGQMCTYIFY